MSVIIDALKKKGLDLKTQELLAETYLRPSRETAPDGTYSKKYPKTLSLIGRPSLLAQLSIIAFLMIILLFALVRFFQFDIKVSSKSGVPYQNLLSSRDVEVFGSASFDRGYVMLTDNASPGPDGVAINLSEGLDLSKNSLVIALLPRRGTVELRIVLRDKNHRSYISDTLSVEESESGRQNFVISGDKPKQSINITDIRQIRLELIQQAGGEGPDRTAFLEKILVVENH